MSVRNLRGSARQQIRRILHFVSLLLLILRRTHRRGLCQLPHGLYTHSQQRRCFLYTEQPILEDAVHNMVLQDDNGVFNQLESDNPRYCLFCALLVRSQTQMHSQVQQGVLRQQRSSRRNRTGEQHLCLR